MSSEEPYRDHAEKLRKRIEKVDAEHDDYYPLPPRSEVHRSKKKRAKWKLKYPMIRILALFFILLPIIIFSVYTYLDNKNNNGSEKVVVSTKGYETINFEKPKKDSPAVHDSKKQNVKENTVKQQANDTNRSEPQTGEKEGAKDDGKTHAFTAPSSRNVSKDDTSGETAVKNVDEPSNHSTNVVSPAISQPSTAGIEQADDKKIVYHTVQPQETLYRIAIKYYHSKLGIETIKKENHLPDNNIRVGQVLRIPLDK